MGYVYAQASNRYLIDENNHRSFSFNGETTKGKSEIKMCLNTYNGILLPCCHIVWLLSTTSIAWESSILTQPLPMPVKFNKIRVGYSQFDVDWIAWSVLSRVEQCGARKDNKKVCYTRHPLIELCAHGYYAFGSSWKPLSTSVVDSRTFHV